MLACFCGTAPGATFARVMSALLASAILLHKKKQQQTWRDGPAFFGLSPIVLLLLLYELVEEEEGGGFVGWKSVRLSPAVNVTTLGKGGGANAGSFVWGR